MAEKKASFVDLVQIEQLRLIEANKSDALSYASVADMDNHTHMDFEYAAFKQRLSARARRLVQDNQLTKLLLHPQEQFVRTGRYVMVVAAILGAFAAGNAVGESATLNIYWLLVVLLGFNLLSIVLWVIGMSRNLQGLSAGVAAQLASWLPYRHKSKNTIESLSARAWWESCLTGSVGKWRMSVLTHKFWLVYLTAGLIMLVLLMVARQYNFIWGTTLLPESTLPTFTEFMAIPMEHLGLVAPDSSQIAASRIGLGEQDTETRSAWARFLLGAILLYGLIPRLVLLGISLLMQKLAERRFKLDLYLPYFIALRQRLMSPKIETQVIDADPQIPVVSIVEKPKPVIKIFPLHTQAIGIELDEQIIWPDSTVCHGNIIDRASFAEALKTMKKFGGPSFLIGVDVSRLPDRGVQRMVKELIASTHKEPWLILLHKPSSPPVANARKLAWFRLAEASNISAEHVITQ
jgi:hypothetical protein